MNDNFNAKGELKAPKSSAIAYCAVAAAFIVFMVVMNFVKDNFDSRFLILAVVIGAVFVGLGLDSAKNRVLYNDECIMVYKLIGKPTEYRLCDLKEVTEGNDDMCLKFDGKLKLYINKRYIGFSEFDAFISERLPECEKII